MHFGATLRLLRLDSGLSLRDLARRLSVSGTYLSRVENGLDSVPTSARLLAIARELDIPPTLLLGLAHRVSPLVVDYVHEVPAAGALFLEIAHRRLDKEQLEEVRQFISARFPGPGTLARHSLPGICDLLTADRIVVDLTCSSIDDVFDVAAGRLGAALGTSGVGLGAALKTREREATGAIGGGVALACVALADTEPPLVVVVTLASSLVLDTPDGMPLGTVIVLAAPRSSPDRRLRLVHLARMTAHGMSAQLAEADSQAAVLACLRRLEVDG
jgi:PTS system nitrogen regulatory IIA component